MKRFALSLLISFVLLSAYFLGVGLLLAFVFLDSEAVASAAVIPLQLPVIVADHLLPTDYDPGYMTTVTVGSVANVFIYAVPIYFLLTLIARIKTASPPRATAPPSPPNFKRETSR